MLLVRAACLTNYHEVAVASGLNPTRMLLDVGLSPSVLNEPDLMIPIETLGRLLQNSADASGNEIFGLSMAKSRQLSNLGIVGLLMRDQLTLRDALDMLLRYQSLLNNALSLSIEEINDAVLIKNTPIVGSKHQPTRQRVELSFGVVVRIIRQLLDSHWQPQYVYFEHSAPKDLRVHTHIFGPSIQFNYDFNCIVLNKADLDGRNPMADPAMMRYLKKLLDDSEPLQEVKILDDVRRTILLLLPTGRCNIEIVSSHLGVVSRTIQRRLASHDQSFSSMVNDIRKELATRYVIESDRSLTDIAELLGFTAPSSFSRWYQAQFGCSAKESREKRQISSSK